MASYIALLRAINVGGHQTVAMADLREFLTGLGFGNPQSLLQSGNLVFDAAGTTSSKLEQRLESESRKRLKLDTPWLVRSAAEWRSVIDHNPFPKEARLDPGHLHVLFLKAAPRPPDVKALQAAIKGREQVRSGSRHLYITYPDGAGNSKLTSVMIERYIGSPGTARNWNTVTKLLAKAGG